MQKNINQKNIRHYRRHTSFINYPKSLLQRLYSAFLGPIIFVGISIVILKFVPIALIHNTQVNIPDLFVAVLATFSRLLTAYLLALICAIPLALLVNYNARAERILLPLFDITQSIPVLAFFPVIIFFFIQYNFFNGAAIFILFLSMLWNLVFSIVGGLTVIPKDIEDAAQIFHIRKFSYIRKVLLPAIFPYIITGSLLAWAQGWNIVIVAEVLHTYIPNGNPSQDLFGIGSSLVNSIATGRNDIFIASIIVMIITIGFLNFFVWQKLLHYGERFKFD